MPNTGLRRANAQKSLPFLAAIASAGVLCASVAAFGADARPWRGEHGPVAQGTLPLPTPGTPPAAPAAPGAPGVPGDSAARARAAALAAKANIDIIEAWTRASGNATTAPVFFHIVSAKDPDKLLGVDASISAKVELHDEMGRSVAVPNIDIPAGGTVNFTPNGRYLTLVGLKAPLKEGDSFLVTFKFDKAGTSSTAVKVLASNATGPAANASVRRNDTTSGVSQR
jgi:copper(I)-binding protein